MGEIRAKVLLTNALDEALHRRKKLKKAQIRRYEAHAVVDTEAIRSVISAHVMDKLGVMSRGQRVVEHADGRKDTAEVTEAITFEILGRNTQDEAIMLGDEVLIGQTILEKLDLLADCANRRLIPNPAHPDQPVTKV